MTGPWLPRASGPSRSRGFRVCHVAAVLAFVGIALHVLEQATGFVAQPHKSADLAMDIHSASRSADGAGPNSRRPWLLGVAAAAAVPVLLGSKGRARAEQDPQQAAQEAAAAEAASRLSVGQVAEDLVLPAWFAGDWACAAELYKVEAGAAGEDALNKKLPTGSAALRAASFAIGTAEADFIAKRRWQSTKSQAPGQPESEGGASEDRDGSSAGALAAAFAIAGPGANVRPTEAGWEVASKLSAAQGKKWQLTAAGAVARPDPEVAGCFRVSELFDATDTAKDGQSLAVRIVSVWRKENAPKDFDVGQEMLKQGTPDKRRPYLVQCIQATYLLSEPSTPTEQFLASYTTRFLYSPIVKA